MPEPDLIELFIGPLEHLQVRYLISGSVAAMLYGKPRVTHDIDLIVFLTPGDAARLPDPPRRTPGMDPAPGFEDRMESSNHMKTNNPFVIITIWLALSATAYAAELPGLKHSFVVIAHRGEHQAHHENTLEAIEGAIAAGADFVELDIRRSKDGHYLLMHDSTVDRMTDGHGPVASLTWAQLEKLAVRDRSSADIPPSRIPSFQEALAHCRNRIHIYLDFKDGDREQVANMIRKAGMAKQVLVYDGVGAIAAWRKAAPEFPLIVSPPDTAAAEVSALEAFLKENPCEVLDDNWSGWTQETVRKAESLGSRVWPDIQMRDENPDYWRRVLDVGITGVQTDHPRELINWLKSENRR